MPRPSSCTDTDPLAWMVNSMVFAWPASASSTELSTTSYTRWCRPSAPTPRMYMCGRLRTASSPSRTLMLSAEYSPAAGTEEGARFSCAVSKISPLGSAQNYHPKRAGSKAKRRSDHSGNRAFSGAIRPLSTRWKTASFTALFATSFGSVVVRTTCPSRPPRYRMRNAFREGADAGVAAFAVARQAAVERFEEPLLERSAPFGQRVRFAAGGEIRERERFLATRDLRERLLRVRPELRQHALAPPSHRGAELRDGLVEARDQVRRGLAPQQLIARAQRPQIRARVGEVGRMAVLRRAVEKLAPPFGSSLDDQDVVGREGDGGEPAKELVGIADCLAVHAGVAPFPSDFDLDFAHATRQLEASSHQRRLVAPDPDQLGELLRPQRPQRAEEMASFEEVRLSLAVRAEQHGRVPPEPDARIGEIAERARVDVEKKHVERISYPVQPRTSPQSHAFGARAATASRTCRTARRRPHCGTRTSQGTAEGASSPSCRRRPG